MKKLMGLLLVVCMSLAIVPVMAENEYYGNMEIINCSEWVSLRKEPKTSAARLEKVPLGAVVTQCQQYGKGWVYAEYDGQKGYIQEKFLQVLEGADVYSAMLITNCEEGTDYYETVGGLKADGIIPAGTVVRNCAVLARGRAYVELGGRGVYVNAEHAVPYTKLTHFPLNMMLHYNYNVFDEGYEAPEQAVKAAYTEDFDLSAYEYTEYDYTQFDPVDEDTPKVHFVLYADTAVKNVHLFSVSIRLIDDETGEEVIDTALEHIQHQMTPEHPLSVTAVMYGDMPNLAVGYEDWTGAYHFAFIETSGEDGSLLLNEF